uniref:B.subtilis tagA, tagB, tagC and tagD genes n=1 Tax=Bacillus subtilis TaxID=1423 RepID=Q45682_BACIU|nr:putative [Bacillus subtilis]
MMTLVQNRTSVLFSIEYRTYVCFNVISCLWQQIIIEVVNL